ncbi:SDR family NAD(P)-dependent oxidoreductase [Algoriphagus sp. oki45]|uniref:SDR family NAD(P)-dependent oxidoreductase n=1 Tax=Algoriphagus sp. oki45 TaxID=3067294 RepID=UPI0027EC4D71|nr:SDR family NAD(P)-dependent oxidoreductase [Algoriphagus sp. oki45]
MRPSLLILTGAASGIGLHMARKCYQAQIPMILIDIRENELKDEFGEKERIKLLVGSVSDPETWNRALVLAKEWSFPISHLINCAGVIRPGFLVDYSLSDIDFHLDINAKGSILGTTIIGREMKVQGFGHIINVSSLAGLAPVSGLSLYVASKFAVRGFSLAVAAELKAFGVKVSVLCPDLVNTPMLDLQLNYPEEAKLTFSGSGPILQPEDVVKAILKLMDKPKAEVTLPASRGWLAKIAGTWPFVGELFRKSLERQGEKNLRKLRK